MGCRGCRVWIRWSEVGRLEQREAERSSLRKAYCYSSIISSHSPNLDLIGINQSWVLTSQSPSLGHVNIFHVTRCKCGLFTDHYGESLPSGADWEARGRKGSAC